MKPSVRRTVRLTLAALMLAAAALSEPPGSEVGPSFGRAGGLGLVAWSEHAGEEGETPPAVTAVDLATGEIAWNVGAAGDLAGTVCVEPEAWLPQLRRLVSLLAIETTGGRPRLQGRLGGRQGVFELDAADGRMAAFEPAAPDPACEPPEPRLRELGSLEVPADRGTFSMERHRRNALDLVEVTLEGSRTVVRRSDSVFRRLWHGPGERLTALVSDLGRQEGRALWSYRLALLEPRTKEVLWHSAPLPAALWHVWPGEETLVAVFGGGYVVTLDTGSGQRLHAAWTWPSLLAAARYGDLEQVEELLADGHRPAPPVLRAAIEAHRPAVVGRLLSAGADPNAQEPDRWPPLHQAALRGSSVLVELLLSAGADPHAEAAGLNAREVAEMAGHAGVAELLPRRPLPARLVRQASAAARAAWLEIATWIP